jgi:uncharacterized membrane protein (DUF373 family)
MSLRLPFLPRRRREQRTWASSRALYVLDRIEDVVHYVVACLLLGIAIIVLVRTVDHLIENRHDFAVQITGGINDLLLAVILLELLRTVIDHLQTAEFQFRSFLIIGIISAVRHILAVGARLTIDRAQSHEEFIRAQIELGVSAAVVLALATALLLVSLTRDMPVHERLPGETP